MKSGVSESTHSASHSSAHESTASCHQTSRSAFIWHETFLDNWGKKASIFFFVNKCACPSMCPRVSPPKCPCVSIFRPLSFRYPEKTVFARDWRALQNAPSTAFFSDLPIWPFCRGRVAVRRLRFVFAAQMFHHDAARDAFAPSVFRSRADLQRLMVGPYKY